MLKPGSAISRCITLSGGRKFATPVVSAAAAESSGVRSESRAGADRVAHAGPDLRLTGRRARHDLRARLHRR